MWRGKVKRRKREKNTERERETDRQRETELSLQCLDSIASYNNDDYIKVLHDPWTSTT